MRTPEQLLSFCLLHQLVHSLRCNYNLRKPCPTPYSRSPLLTTSPPGKGLEFYKEVMHPWEPLEFGNHSRFDWDSHFDELLMNGTRNFILPGYMLQNNMIVYSKMFSQLEAWDKSKFMALRGRVKAKGGKIVAYLRRGLQDQFKDFDKEILKSSVREFMEAYPVDGFWMVNDWFDEDQLAVTKKRFEAFKELGIVTTVKSYYYEWHRALETGIPQLADFNVVTLEPRVKGEASDSERGLFLTDAIAEKAIKNATEAGVQADKLILEISSVAKTYDKSDDPRGSSITNYHDVITKFGADPDGDGTVFGPDGRLYYFYSRTRAIGKVRLAKRFGLHGIAVDHLELQ